MTLGESLLDMGNRLAGIQVLGTDLGAIHDCMAAIQFKGIVQLGQTLLGFAIATVFNPSIGLHQNGGTQILVGVPPVTGTTRRATGAQDTLVHAIEFGSILLGLQVFALTGLLFHGRLQPRFNAPVLFVKVAHVGDQIFNDIHVREWINFARRLQIGLINVRETGEGIDAVNVHGARSANAFATRAPKGEGGILLILDLEQGIEDHGTAVVQINRIGAQIGLLILFGIPAIDFEILDTLLLVGRHRWRCEFEIGRLWHCGGRRRKGPHDSIGALCRENIKAGHIAPE
jgi:hypothetical protein